MITKLYLENWKSFENGTLCIDPLTVLIGTNASGKSNILDALNFLQRTAHGTLFSDIVNGDVHYEGIRGGAEWLIRHGEDGACIGVLVRNDEETYEYDYKLHIQKKRPHIELAEETLTRYTINSKGERRSPKKLFYSEGKNDAPSLAAYFFTGTQGHGKKITFDRASSILSHTRALTLMKDVADGCKLVLDCLKSIFILDSIPSHMRQYSPFSEKLRSDASNIAGVLAALDKEKKEAVEMTISSFAKDIPEKELKRIWAEPVGKFNSDAMLYCEEGWLDEDSIIVDARGMSDGTLRFLGILTALLTLDKGSLLVIEEIDNGLHPSRAHHLVAMLRQLGTERAIDIVCTTHNPALLDALGNEIIPFISVIHRNEDGASAITLLEDFENLPKLMAIGPVGKLATKGLLERNGAIAGK